MKLVKIFMLLLLSSSVFATADSGLSDNNNKKMDVMYPVTTSAIAGSDADGNRFVSLDGRVQRAAASTAGVYTRFSQAWSYGRGVGTIPSQCADGYDNKLLGCFKPCPAGYNDIGLLCSQSKDSQPSNIDPNVIAKQYQPKQCAEGLENDAGLCYKPCASKFKGIGPMCHGDLADLDVSQVPSEVARQHQKAMAVAMQPGLLLKKNKAPRLKTNILFSPAFCAMAAPVKLAASAIEKLTNKGIGALSDKLGSSKIKDHKGSVIWVSPKLADFTVFDFSANADCSEDERFSKAKLAIDTSITLKVGTQMFDKALNNLGGVDIGVAKLSIYELIPFRIYGAVGSTMGAKANLNAQIDKTDPVVVKGQKIADKTVLALDPYMNLWLSSEAYLRITSFTDALPDLFQVGAKFKLNIMDWSLPYRLEEGVKRGPELRTLYMKESLSSKLASGNGALRPFMKILGIEVNAFRKEHTKAWKGYEKEKSLLIREGEYEL